MQIIQIAPLENGAHANQTINVTLEALPDGWAIIPEGVSIPGTFPFVHIDSMVDRDGAPYVTAMSENREAYDAAMAEQEQPEAEPTQLDRVEAQATYTAMMTDTLLEV